ncbi:uncharacterized protein LOC121368057 isoform X2 [Gigantopelta aegis]|uniref:uncharacterized protein LOC121368057 isoform X2 n=1 Tax=Gigantopelta aegis TaxID=1735272 RepID=UPI001B889832|nr:uncharacterized protein LOC121368057 isoform X2 [Gigantopelta aegis]
MDLSEIYEVGASEKVQELENELKIELEELRGEMEEATVTSFPLPKDIVHFRTERKLILKRALEVSEARPLAIQAEQMKEEMMNATQQEYTAQNISLLLHQHFTERIQQLVQSRHSHMLRWKRFCEHTSTIEVMYPLYKEKLSKILAEYHDNMQRAQRLSVAREFLFSGNETPISVLKMEDLRIYLRWLVCHLHSVKKFNQYMKIIQWLPVTHKDLLSVADIKSSRSESILQRITKKRKFLKPVEQKEQLDDSQTEYQEEASDFFGRSLSPRPSSASPAPSPTPVPVPPPIHPALVSSNPLPLSSLAMLNAAAAAVRFMVHRGGLASDEKSFCLPLHVNDFVSLKPHIAFLINIYGISYDLESVKNSADEMEMFAAVSRKFKQAFQKQEHMRVFKLYDRTELGDDMWATGSATHALKKDSNWLQFIKLKPETDQEQEKHWTRMRQDNIIDELLRVEAHFLKVSDVEQVQDTLKDHAKFVCNPPVINPVSVTSHRTHFSTSNVWRKIYGNPDLYKDCNEDTRFDEFDENLTESGPSKSATARKRKESFDYMTSIQMLGLDEEEHDRGSAVNIQGAFLSFLELRHLRIRDLQRTCLSILNYFRSIERTLTINDVGLSHEGGVYTKKSAQNHRNHTETSGTVGGGGGLGSHTYLHNTPADFKVSESEFVEFDEVENHDDFYSSSDGRVHVQDQRGYYIMYDAALNDMKTLENNLLLVASMFIEKDRELRQETNIKGMDSSRKHSQQTAGDFNISDYAHQGVDRFGVLLDLWSSHTAFLECKRELLDCYYEAYQHVFDRDERRNLAQVITNVMGRAPRFDFSGIYFVRTYRSECTILHYYSTLVKKILNAQIEDNRAYIQRVSREEDSQYGLPNKIVTKQPISVNLSRSALKNIYMLEFHPSLAIASRIPDAFKHAYWELVHIHRPENVQACLKLEKKLLKLGHEEWDRMECIGKSFSKQLQKDLFHDVYMEDPLFMCAASQSLIVEQESQGGSNRSSKEKRTIMVSVLTRVLEAITTRHRLLDSCWETEILSKHYRKQAGDMGFEEFHLFMRFVQFEFANYKDDAGKPPPIFITSIQEDDSALDKYTPSFLSLAIHELDEGHVGRFSFHNKDGFLQVLRPGGLESLQVTLKTQIVHKNALIAAVLQANNCLSDRHEEVKTGGRASPMETKSEKSSTTQYTGFSSGTQRTSLGDKLNPEQSKGRRSADAFVSIQMEKTPSRDIMLNEFVEKKAQMGTILKNPDELEKLKRKLISDFCENFNLRVSQFSLRAQIIAYYSSILTLLEEFPSIKETYFMLGDRNEKKTGKDTLEGLKDDPRTISPRPRRVLSANGQYVLNIWFIPHYTEILVMYKTLDDMKCARALNYSLCIAATLHDMLHYLCAHSKLGTPYSSVSSQKQGSVSADWGGSEGVGAELRHIQKQINHLPHPSDPSEVVDFLTLRRDVMFLQFDTAVRHCMTDTFLSTGNMEGFKSITENMYHALPALSNVQKPSIYSIYMSIPEPLEPRDFQARQLYPWRSFNGRSGIYPLVYWQWHLIEHHIQTCLAGLKDVERHVANGEILGVTLLMEDVLATGFQDNEPVCNIEVEDHKSRKSISGSSFSFAKVGRMNQETMEERNLVDIPLSTIHEPVEAYILLKFFLKLWKCLELAKHDWGRRKLQVQTIDKSRLFREFCKIYRAEILLPVLQSVARRLGQGDLYEGQVLDTDMLVMPHGASEIEVRAKQLVRLFETMECHMINEIRKKVAKESSLSISERVREEDALPTDLWKKPVMKESYTVARPHLAETFIDELMSDYKENEETITFSKEHFHRCCGSLSRAVMAREKASFLSYSMYYENLLRVHHHLLYQKELEIQHVQDLLKTAQFNQTVDVQYQLGSQAHDLIMEVTALRAKVAEMRNMSLTQERDIREKVKAEYDDLIQNMFNSTFQLRAKFDEFRGDLYDDVFDKIKETRRIAIEEMCELQKKSGSTGGHQHLLDYLGHTDQMRNLQHENHNLSSLVLKMKAMNRWRQNHYTNNFHRKIGELSGNADDSKKEVIQVKMLAEEKSILLQQELEAIKKALTTAEKECEEVRKRLEKELKIKMEKAHELKQKRRSKKQLEQAKQANIEKLLEELEDKEMRLAMLTEEQDRSGRLQQLMQEKVKKDVEGIKKRLLHERSLKLDAFQRVDELQAAVYDYEDLMTTGSQYMATPPASAKPVIRATSAGTRGLRSSLSSRSGLTSGGVWPPPITWPSNRAMSPLEGGLLNNADWKQMQRPKTLPNITQVGGRFRTQIAEQLLNELEPNHQTMIEELQL